jgi:hypothetical protein
LHEPSPHPTQCPVTSQLSVGAQPGAQTPPQPSEPHDLPAQFGAQQVPIRLHVSPVAHWQSMPQLLQSSPGSHWALPQ